MNEIVELMHGKASVSNWSETEGVLGPSNLRVSTVKYAKSYVNEIRGIGEVQLEYCYLSGGRVEFMGYELFSGSVSGQRGSFMMSIKGSIEPIKSTVSASVLIVDKSGCDELHAISGEGSFVISGSGYCSYEMSLRT